jgi:hypothetical protein
LLEDGMDGQGTEALVAALEACADALERQGWAPDQAGAGSLPRLRPASMGGQLGRMAPPVPGPEMMPEGPPLTRDALELAAEFRDAAREASRGEAGRGWINSLLGRASRHLEEAELAPVRMAARGMV